MKKNTIMNLALGVVLAAIMCVPCAAALTIPLSPAANGSDGIFDKNFNYTVDLSQAVTGTWDQVSPNSGKGVYDPQKWAVVFKYSSVVIPQGVTIKFKNHPSGAPVVWIVGGDVLINGVVSLNGAIGHDEYDLRTLSEPGPGGFRGGRGQDTSSAQSGGLGPGGASASTSSYTGAAGSYSLPGARKTLGYPGPAVGPVYGNGGVCPLVGGSGGSGNNSYDTNYRLGGGAGGGAILIVAAGSVAVNGQVTATGGNGRDNGNANDARQQRASGGGSGGAVRIVAEVVDAPGKINAAGGASYSYPSYGYYGSPGRIRVERNSGSTIVADPLASLAPAGTTPKIWPADTEPSIRLISLGGVTIPADPKDALNFAGADVYITEPGSKQIVVEAKNVPTHWQMRVRMVPRSGFDKTFTAAMDAGGTQNLSVWRANVDVPALLADIQVRVSEDVQAGVAALAAKSAAGN